MGFRPVQQMLEGVYPNLAVVGPKSAAAASAAVAAPRLASGSGAQAVVALVKMTDG